MKREIEAAFSHRQRPATVTAILVDSELCDDARQFEGMDWKQVTADDWHRFRDAFYGFSPEAFVYFLPSLLVTSLDAVERELPAESLIDSLDTSADPAIWPEWFAERFSILTLPELEVLDGWLAVYLDGATTDAGSRLHRAQETIMMLKMLAEQ